MTCLHCQGAEICFCGWICVCTPPLLICLSHPLACHHASTSHTLALGRSGSTRDVPAKSSSTSSLDPNTCNTKPWQPPSTHYQSYSIYRRYTRLHHGHQRPSHTQLSSLTPAQRCSALHHAFLDAFTVSRVEFHSRLLVLLGSLAALSGEGTRT